MLVTMVDSIESPQTTGHPIPQAILTAEAVGAYAYGNSWPTEHPYEVARPDLAIKGWVVSITLSTNGLPKGVARCGDFETGGIPNDDVGVFLNLADRSLGLPWLYTFASNGAALLSEAARAGWEQDRDFYYWSAHTGDGAHICEPDVCGFPRANGTQYGYLPGNCDVSLLNDYMLPRPHVIIDLDREDGMIAATTDNKGNAHVFVEVPHSKDDPTQGSTVYEAYQTDGVHWAGGSPGARKAAAYSLVRIPQDVQ